MTREEAISFLDNTKVYVQGKSKEIQEKMFSLGFQWKFDGKNKATRACAKINGYNESVN